MTMSVVGLFDNTAQAQAVSQELVSQGIAQGAIQMLADDARGERKGSDGDGDGNGNGHGVKGFFTRLGDMLGLTDPDDTSIRYEEGVRRGGVLVVVRAADDQADRVVTVLQRHGAVDIDERAETWQKEGAATAATTATAATAATTAATTATAVTDTVRSAGQAEVALPVIEEELRVGKRVVQRGGVRVYTNVSERPVEEQIRLREERVSVERHPVDRPVTDADLRTFEQGSFEVTERAEEAVVSKQARIVEEVVVSKQVAERTEAIRDTLRRTDVEVESIAPGAPTFDAYSTDFQQHFTTSFGSTGGTFEQYTPAYRYGLGLASDPRYRGVDWSTLEADARRSWEENEPGTWERFKDAIKYAWQKVQNKLQS
ncbi:MAG: YsnF/AvaK domain-containing protein [Polyangia bacterium]